MIEPELMRSCILEALHRAPQTQFGDLRFTTARVAAERELRIDNNGHMYWLLREDDRRFRETVWALINEGIIVQGIDEQNAGWPFLSLTEYGEEYASGSGPTPYDPGDYLTRIGATSPLDPTEERYLPQALAAFRKGLPDASAVMLGAVSEHLLILLAEVIAEKDPGAAPAMNKKLQGHVLPLLRELRQYFENRFSKLSRDLQEGLGTTFSGVADLIRITRNDAGHPRLEPVSREQVFTNLQLFPRYRAWVVEAMAALPL